MPAASGSERARRPRAPRPRSPPCSAPAFSPGRDRHAGGASSGRWTSRCPRSRSRAGSPPRAPALVADPSAVDPVLAARGARGRAARAGRAEGSSPSPVGRVVGVLGEARVSGTGSSDVAVLAAWAGSSEVAGLGPWPLPRPPLPRPPRLRRRGVAGAVPSVSFWTSVVDETSSRTGTAATELGSSVMLDAPFAVAGAIGGVGERGARGARASALRSLWGREGALVLLRMRRFRRCRCTDRPLRRIVAHVRIPSRRRPPGRGRPGAHPGSRRGRGRAALITSPSRQHPGWARARPASLPTG